MRVIQEAKLDDAEWIRVRQEQLMLITDTCKVSYRIERGRPGNIHVAQFWENGHWHLLELNRVAPTHKIQDIMQIHIYYKLQSQD